MQFVPGKRRVRFLKCNVALIILGGYCSCVTLRFWHVQSLGTSHHNNHIFSSPPWWRKDGMPSCQAWLIGGQKEGWLISVTYISVVLIASLLAVTWILRCPASLLMASPSNFLPPCRRSCFKVPSDRSRSSCRDVSQQGPQASLVGELVTGDPMACSIVGCPHKHPSSIVAHRQIWQLLPGLEHGRVESINQLAQYHTQFNTPMEWHHQFCSSETRFDRYAVHPEWLAFQFGKPKKQSCPVEYLPFSCSHHFQPHMPVSRPPRI